MALPVKRQTPLREMFKLRDIRILTGLAWLVWLGSVVLPSIQVARTIYGKTAVPLHYNIHVGVDTIGPWWQIYTVPAIGLAILLVNLILARYMWTRDPMLSHVAVTASLVLQVVMLAAMIFIVFLSLSYA